MEEQTLPELMLAKLVSRDKKQELISTGEAFSWVRMFGDREMESRDACNTLLYNGVVAKHRKSNAPDEDQDRLQQIFSKAKSDPDLGVYYSLQGALTLHKKGDADIQQKFAENTGFAREEEDQALSLLSQKVETMRGVSKIQRLEDTIDILCRDARETLPAKERVSAAKAAKRIFS